MNYRMLILAMALTLLCFCVEAPAQCQCSGCSAGVVGGVRGGIGCGLLNICKFNMNNQCMQAPYRCVRLYPSQNLCADPCCQTIYHELWCGVQSLMANLRSGCGCAGRLESDCGCESVGAPNCGCAGWTESDCGCESVGAPNCGCAGWIESDCGCESVGAGCADVWAGDASCGIEDVNGCSGDGCFQDLVAPKRSGRTIGVIRGFLFGKRGGYPKGCGCGGDVIDADCGCESVGGCAGCAQQERPADNLITDAGRDSVSPQQMETVRMPIQLHRRKSTAAKLPTNQIPLMRRVGYYDLRFSDSER